MITLGGKCVWDLSCLGFLVRINFKMVENEMFFVVVGVVVVVFLVLFFCILWAFCSLNAEQLLFETEPGEKYLISHIAVKTVHTGFDVTFYVTLKDENCSVVQIYQWLFRYGHCFAVHVLKNHDYTGNWVICVISVVTLKTEVKWEAWQVIALSPIPSALPLFMQSTLPKSGHAIVH